MKQIYNDSVYVANYNKEDDSLEVIKKNFCLLSYKKIKPGISVGLCGNNIFSLKIEDILVSGFEIDLIDKIVNIFIKNKIMPNKNAKILNKLINIANKCIVKIEEIDLYKL